MELFHLSAECYPVAKVGGLADVVGALPKYLNKLGHEAKVVLPGYDNAFTAATPWETRHQGSLSMGNQVYDYTVLEAQSGQLGFPLFVIAIPGLFDRPGIYAYADDSRRFMAFQLAFLDWLIQTGQSPDIIHCHDHHCGLVPFLMQHAYAYQSLKNIPTLLTIHNGQYQGWFSKDQLQELPAFDHHHIGLLEWNGVINPLAAGIKCAWKVTTVSPSYLDEISHEANGLQELLQRERPKSIGILNGIDTEVWNSKTDPMLEANYSVAAFKKGKEANKKFLCQQFGLDPKKPLFVFIGRLVHEKGADLLAEIAHTALLTDKDSLSFLVLGSGDTGIENNLNALKHYHEGSYNCYIGYHETLAHILYGGADFLLMPSRVEPCGLNQMYALRYGTIPIVRRTGGLRDTVIDFGDGGFGICHDQVSVFDVCHSISRGISLYNDTATFNQIRKTCMKIDHSWDKVAQDYVALYQSLKPSL